MAAPAYGNAPFETIDVLALKSSRFFLVEKRQLPYRDEQGRVTLSLLQKSIAALTSGKVKVADGVLEKLQKWEKHTLAHFEKSPVTWEQRKDGTWRSSAGETRRTVVRKRDAPTAPTQPVAKRPTAASDGPKSDAQLRKEKMEMLAQRVRVGGLAAAGDSSAATKASGLDRQETSSSGKRHRAAISDASAAASKARGDAGSKRPATKPQQLGADHEEEIEAEDGDDDGEEEEEDDDDDDEEGGALDAVLSNVGSIADKMRTSLAPLLRTAEADTHTSGGAMAAAVVSGPPSPLASDASDAPPDGADDEEEGSGGGEGAPGSRQPKLITKSLKMAPHQLIGLSWLHGLHRTNANGILADEMGLGMAVHSRPPSSPRGPSLARGPSLLALAYTAHPRMPIGRLP